MRQQHLIITVLSVAFAFGLTLSASGNETALLPSSGEEVAKEQPPLKLNIAINDIYGTDTACSCVHDVATRKYSDFFDRLREKHSIEIVPAYYPEIYDLIKDFKAGKFDGAICKPWFLLQPKSGSPQKLLRAADLQDPFGNTLMWGILIVPKNSKFRTLGELSGKRMTCGENDNYEKSHAVRKLLKAKNISIQPKNISARASCLECLDLLIKGVADVAAISNYALTADCGADVAKPEDFRVLAETERIPLTSLLVDIQKVPRKDALRLQKALLEVSKTSLPKSMGGGGFVLPQPWSPSELSEK